MIGRTVAGIGSFTTIGARPTIGSSISPCACPLRGGEEASLHLPLSIFWGAGMLQPMCRSRGRDGAIVESARTRLDYVPANSVRRGGLVFTKDPAYDSRCECLGTRSREPGCGTALVSAPLAHRRQIGRLDTAQHSGLAERTGTFASYRGSFARPRHPRMLRLLWRQPCMG